MLLITNDTAYRVCVTKNSEGNDCEDSCSSGQKLLIDADGNKCVSQDKGCSDYGKITLIPEGICVTETVCDSSIFTFNGTHCGLCRDIDSNKKYKFINGTECLSQIPTEGVKIYNGIYLY